MAEEILNIEYHTKILVIKALNRSGMSCEAAQLLGISERTLYRYKKQYNIGYDPKKDCFYFRGEKVTLLNHTTHV